MRTRIATGLFSIGFFFIAAQSSAQAQWVTDSASGFLPCYSHTSVVFGEKIYVMGGFTETLIDTLQVFDPSAHSWSTPATFGPHFNRGAVGSAFVINDKIYFVGSNNRLSGDSINIFDPGTSTWSSNPVTGTSPTASEFAAAAVNGEIYVVGGHDINFNALNVVIFDPGTNYWTIPATTGTFAARYDATASVVDGKIYIVGGSGSGSAPAQVPSVQIFDPSANTWSTPQTTGTFTQRGYLTSCVVAGKIYAIGGSPLTSHYGLDMVDTVEIFDPSNNTWSPGPSMHTQRDQLSSAVIGNKIYAIGGYFPHSALNTVEVLDVGNLSAGWQPFREPLAAYPNPTPGPITLRGIAGPIRSVDLLNALGVQVATFDAQRSNSGEVACDLSSLPAGMYFIRFNTAEGIVDRKIIKK